MAFKQFYPLKDGQFLSSWDSVSFHLNGSTEPIKGSVQSFDFKMSLQGGDFVYGSSDGNLPIGRKKGKLAVSGSFSVLDTFWFDLIEEFKTFGPLHTQWSMIIASKNPDGTPRIVEIQKANITEFSTSYKIGELNLVNISFQAFTAKVNGIDMVVPEA